MKKMDGISRTRVKALLANRVVLVDNNIQTQYNFPLKPGMKVQVSREKNKHEFRHPMLKILYEDAYLIVVEKKEGLLSVATDHQKERTAQHILNEYVKRTHRNNRIFVVHRLDPDRKLYVSSSPIDDGGKLSITHYRTIKRANGYSLMELQLETGRKNQIRVHMQSLGHPVVGDARYGCETDPLGRLALHAFKLCFYHPLTGERMEFETPYPAPFKNLMLRK